MKTHRLVLHHFQEEHAKPLFEFMRDADAMKHTYVAPSYEKCLARLSAYEAMRPTLGFAPWVVHTAREAKLIGWGGLSVDPEKPEWGLEVSDAFAPHTWGQGYATELVMHSLAYAFGVLSANDVHAFAKPQNAASVRVLLKCSFGMLRYEPGLERNHYLATRAVQGLTPRSSGAPTAAHQARSVVPEHSPRPGPGVLPLSPA